MRRRRGEVEQDGLAREAVARASAPERPTPVADVLALQRSAGNAAVARMLGGGRAPATLQRAIERKGPERNHRFTSANEYLEWLLADVDNGATAFHFGKDKYKVGLLEDRIKQSSPVTVVETPAQGAALLDSLIGETAFVKDFQPGDKAYGMEVEARRSLVDAVEKANKQAEFPTVDTIHNNQVIMLTGGVDNARRTAARGRSIRPPGSATSSARARWDSSTSPRWRTSGSSWPGSRWTASSPASSRGRPAATWASTRSSSI
jgi:hypothetical protein